MNSLPRNNLQSRRAFSFTLGSLLLSMNTGCKSPAPKVDSSETTSQALAKKTVNAEEILKAQKEKEQYFIAKLQDLHCIEDKNTLYTQLIELCKEALIHNGKQMTMKGGGGRSLKNFSEQLEAFAKQETQKAQKAFPEENLPAFKMEYDLPSIKKGEKRTSYHMAVGDNQLFMAVERMCQSLQKRFSVIPLNLKQN